MPCGTTLCLRHVTKFTHSILNDAQVGFLQSAFCMFQVRMRCTLAATAEKRFVWHRWFVQQTPHAHAIARVAHSQRGRELVYCRHSVDDTVFVLCFGRNFSCSQRYSVSVRYITTYADTTPMSIRSRPHADANDRLCQWETYIVILV